jgi:hypothetical protein
MAVMERTTEFEVQGVCGQWTVYQMHFPTATILELYMFQHTNRAFIHSVCVCLCVCVVCVCVTVFSVIFQ